MRISGPRSGSRLIALLIPRGATVHDYREGIELWRRDEFECVGVAMVERRAAHEQLGLDQIGPTAVVVEGDVAAVSVGAERLFQKISRAYPVSGVAALGGDGDRFVVRPGLARRQQHLPARDRQ